MRAGAGLSVLIYFNEPSKNGRMFLLLELRWMQAVKPQFSCYLRSSR